eukprot:11417310-Heterocapsa_arctica.AAC.1
MRRCTDASMRRCTDACRCTHAPHACRLKALNLPLVLEVLLPGVVLGRGEVAAVCRVVAAPRVARHAEQLRIAVRVLARLQEDVFGLCCSRCIDW